MNSSCKNTKSVSPLDITMMVLSLVTICLVLLRMTFDLGEETSTLFYNLDSSICYILLTHLGYGFFKADDKKQYLKTHWIDFIASIPMTEHLRYARLLQIVRIARLLQHKPNLLQHLKSQYQEATIASVILFLVILLVAGSTTILMLESSAPDGNIKTAGDAFWWTVVTVSTVGYGDLYPVTDWGRTIAMGLIVCGVGTFAAVTGLMASFLAPTNKSENQIKNHHLLHEIQQLREEVAKLQQQATHSSEDKKSD
ncbi:potassium channel family protein [Motilimonas cestriensis]|uniref:Potassium channel family protein n=1 Tax=Motilimonas cestriensis TaxID=2742685 RepID=A0ABS8WAC3_9GAMM|nr:potassium channel family protein [Motilimonas cestriensis]MCE2595974.1 potassium channel family protein [Motilimonas cestriensis]